jgi:hypothetical protein
MSATAYTSAVRVAAGHAAVNAITAMVEPLFNAITLGVQSLLAALATLIEFLVDAIATCVEIPGAGLVALVFRVLCPIVQACVDPVALGVEPLLCGKAPLVQPLVDPFTALIEALVHAVPAILRQRRQCEQGKQATGNQVCRLHDISRLVDSLLVQRVMPAPVDRHADD